jgi:hypothetical protein
MLPSLNRADDGLRTRDLQLGKLALYQLSYVRVGEDFIMRDTSLPPQEARCCKAVSLGCG